LHAAYRESAHAPLLVLVDGAPGVGKTTLLRAFHAQLRQERDPPLVLATRCCERERVPYRALDGLIDCLWRELTTMGRRARLLIPPELAALARLFPVMATFVGDAASAVAESPYVLREQATCALAALLRALMRPGLPVALLLDDLHWGDLDSARMLLSLIEPSAAPLFVLATSRIAERGQSPCLLELTRNLDVELPRVRQQTLT
jgi:predicted ATPase